MPEDRPAEPVWQEAPDPVAPRGTLADPSHRRFLACGILGIVLGWLAVNFLFAANERVSVDHPPNYPDFYVGIALTVAAIPLALLAWSRRGTPRALGWVGIALSAFAVFCIVGILL